MKLVSFINQNMRTIRSRNRRPRNVINLHIVITSDTPRRRQKFWKDPTVIGIIISILGIIIGILGIVIGYIIAINAKLENTKEHNKQTHEIIKTYYERPSNVYLTELKEPPKEIVTKVIELQNEGNFEAAGRILNEVGKYVKNSNVFYDLKGVNYLGENKDEMASKEFDKSLALDPNNALVLQHKGTALLAQSKFDEAIIYYEMALAINANDAVSLYNKGAILCMKNNPDEATKYFEKALSINSKLTPQKCQSTYAYVTAYPSAISVIDLLVD